MQGLMTMQQQFPASWQELSTKLDEVQKSTLKNIRGISQDGDSNQEAGGVLEVKDKPKVEGPLQVNILSPLLRLVPTAGIFSLPSRDWCLLGDYGGRANTCAHAYMPSALYGSGLVRTRFSVPNSQSVVGAEAHLWRLHLTILLPPPTAHLTHHSL
eukprot:348865-Prorocentrum_minimum.AAC.1